MREAAIDVIRAKGDTASLEPDEREIVEYARELARTKRVSPERFDRLLARHGERWLVELTAAAHFYVFLSGVANAFDVPVPDDGDRLG